MLNKYCDFFVVFLKQLSQSILLAVVLGIGFFGSFLIFGIAYWPLGIFLGGFFSYSVYLLLTLLFLSPLATLFAISWFFTKNMNLYITSASILWCAIFFRIPMMFLLPMPGGITLQDMIGTVKEAIFIWQQPSLFLIAVLVFGLPVLGGKLYARRFRNRKCLQSLPT